MLRRFTTLALTLSLATTALTTTADARSFAQAPASDREAPVAADPGPDALKVAPRSDHWEAPRLAPAVRARLRQVLAARRARNVAAFRAYARRGIYPHNYVNSSALNVWIDEDNHMCAAATMIFKSGARTLVRQVARTDNNIRLADIHRGPLMDWMLTSGLTQAEIVAIQLPMVGAPERPVRPGRDWRIAEDARLRALYAGVLTTLATDRADSLEAALDALATRPDLVATLLGA